MDWSELSIGVAAVLLVFYVVREFRSLLRETLNFFGNHMSENVKVQREVSKTLSELSSAVGAMAQAQEVANDALAVIAKERETAKRRFQA